MSSFFIYLLHYFLSNTTVPLPSYPSSPSSAPPYPLPIHSPLLLSLFSSFFPPSISQPFSLSLLSPLRPLPLPLPLLSLSNYFASHLSPLTPSAPPYPYPYPYPHPHLYPALPPISPHEPTTSIGAETERLFSNDHRDNTLLPPPRYFDRLRNARVKLAPKILAGQ